jgi:hypothetical protein
MRSPLWLISRLVLIPKPSDISSAPITLRSLGLPEIFDRLAGCAAVCIEGPLVGSTMEPVQLGVGIPFGCKIGGKGAQCAFDARKALLAVDLNNALNTEKRQSTFQGVSALVPRLLRYYMWGYGRETPLIWHGQQVGSSGTRVKQGDPAGPSTSQSALIPSSAPSAPPRSTFPSCLLLWGSRQSAITFRSCRTLNSRPLVQRKILESGRSLNIAKCRILVHPDSAHLVEWLPQWRPGLRAALPLKTHRAKLLGAPIGTEPFGTDFVELRASKACASVSALEHLPPSATWTILRYCVNERLNFQAQVTEFPLVQDSFSRMDEIINHAFLHAGGLPPEPPDPLTHFTTLTLRSLLTELGGLGIRRYCGLAGETACLSGRTDFTSSRSGSDLNKWRTP